MKWLVALAMAFTAGLSHADVRPFETGSLAEIRAAREGRPFILAFWSLDCAHCPMELKTLGKLKKLHPGIELVLVSTDSPANASELATFAAGQGLEGAEQWVFSDPQPEKLRFEIDRRWWGELPRTYFFEADHKRTAISGTLSMQVLQQWQTRNSAGSQPQRGR